MTTPDKHQSVPGQQDVAEDYSFDNLAKGLASGAVSRRRALKLVGGGILGAALGVFSSQGTSQAQTFAERLCGAGNTPCYGISRQGATVTCCPPGTKCCRDTFGRATCCRTNSLVDTCRALLVITGLCVPGCIPDIEVGGLIPIGVDSCQE